ncbi:MAG: glutamate--tRNA ligase [Acidimicrobiales bacterium]
MTPGTTRVRFAPSPTGYFHVGSARTALFNWLFARQRQGTFILRIEDTDKERNREEWVEGIVSSMTWLGLVPDEGPYRQSERGHIYAAAVEFLWEAGYLYACDCSRDEIDARRMSAGSDTALGYDAHCRDLGLQRSAGRALRFKTPREGVTVVDDLVRGNVEFPHHAMEDFVVVKSSGQPLFLLANVVDDRDMGITHVIRGEDLLPSTPKGILLWQALNGAATGTNSVVDFGAGANASASVNASDGAGAGTSVPLPQFAHLPMLVNEQRKKLSKRKDPVSVESYRDSGFLSQTFRNYLALLGWSPPGGVEKVSLETLVSEFSLEQVNHAPAFFDVVKMTHMNGEYIREMSVDEFVTACMPWVSHSTGEWAPSNSEVPWPKDRFDDGLFRRIAPMVQERVTLLEEVVKMVDFFFLIDPALDASDWEVTILANPISKEILSLAVVAYEDCEWNAQILHRVTSGIADAVGLRLGKAQAPIRVSVTGRKVGPPLFESLEILGRNETLRRIRNALFLLDPSDDVKPGGDSTTLTRPTNTQ